LTRLVAITGRGLVTPFGVGLDVALDGVFRQPDDTSRAIANSCAVAEPREFLSRKELQRNSRFAQLALIAAQLAMQDAGLDAAIPCDAESVRCIVGTGLGGAEMWARPPAPTSVPMAMPSSAAAAISMRYGLTGEVFGLSTACASGNHAIGLGYRAIKHEHVPIAIVGAAEAASIASVRGSFASAGVLAEDRSFPFSTDGDGFAMAEGAGILVLEDYESAIRRGAPIAGFVLGYGASSEAYSATGSYPGGSRTAQAIRAAMTDAGLPAEAIDVIKAHGTGTDLNDTNEIDALRIVFGDELSRIPLYSLKGSLGHLLGASGAVETALAVSMLNERRLAPTSGCRDTAAAQQYAAVVRQPLDLPDRQKRPALVSLCNSFGFGGHNASLVVASADWREQ
jgi:3-oxoacyl-[acyl-carrier-protein] synthase II